MPESNHLGVNTLSDFIRIHVGLSDETRVRIVNLLLQRPCRVGEIASALNISQPRTSQHLRVLRETGLVAAKKQGNSRIYTVDCQVFYRELLACLIRLRQVCRVLQEDLEQLEKNHTKESVST